MQTWTRRSGWLLACSLLWQGLWFVSLPPMWTPNGACSVYRSQAIKCSCRLRLLAHRPIRADLGSDDLEELLHPGMMGRYKSVYELVAGLPRPERRPAARRLQQMRRAEDRMHDRTQRLSELEPDKDYAEISNQIDEHGQRRFLEKIDPLTLEEKRRWWWRR